MFLIFILIYIVNKDVDGHSVNLAKGRQVKLCNNTLGSNNIADNDRIQLAQSISKVCRGSYELEIILKENLYVHWVVIYGSSLGIDIGSIPLYVDKIGSRTEECGMNLLNKNNNSMRVNCINNDNHHLKVTFKLRVVPFLINEIELFSLASGENMEVLSIYRGCFKEFIQEYTIEIPIYDMKVCHKLCLSSDYSFAAIKNKKLCFCGNTYNEEDAVDDLKCNLKCSRFNKFCGGIDHYSIYMVYIKLPYFLGCIDYYISVSDELRGNMTISKCLRHCDYSLFAVLEEGDVCYCTNETYEMYDYFDSFNKCNSVCSGDSTNYCGSEVASTILGTCLTNLNGSMPCSKLFHCSGSWNEFGVCTDGCVENYVGDHCLEKDISNMFGVQIELAIALTLLLLVLCIPVVLLIWSMNKMVKEVIRDRNIMEAKRVSKMIARKLITSVSDAQQINYNNN